MRKHNRDHRRLTALTNFYRRHTRFYTDWLREYGETDWLREYGEGASEHADSKARELHALESRLPPEMVAWARLNR